MLYKTSWDEIISKILSPSGRQKSEMAAEPAASGKGDYNLLLKFLKEQKANICSHTKGAFTEERVPHRSPPSNRGPL